MSQLSIESMRHYLSKSISSLNRNKINGLLAEIELRKYLQTITDENRISPGGWIVRSVGPGIFGHHTAVLFPQTIIPAQNFELNRNYEEPPLGLHTICSTMHQIGIKSYYCIPAIKEDNNPDSVLWLAKQLGIPYEVPYTLLDKIIQDYTVRNKKYNYLRYKTDSSLIPSHFLSEEFSKENLRVIFCSKFLSEVSDIDGIFWGQQYTYPIEIKEKTAASDKKLGEYFGLDVGPFVKLAFYAAKRGNLHSLYIVREIDNVEKRNLLNWWYITFDTLAQFASWNAIGGGKNMLGGGSTVVKIPKAEFKLFNEENLSQL